jgi:predicted CXXCH cytochrome family protein
MVILMLLALVVCMACVKGADANANANAPHRTNQQAATPTPPAGNNQQTAPTPTQPAENGTLPANAGDTKTGGTGTGTSAPSYMDSYTGADATPIGTTACLRCHASVVPEGNSHISIFEDKEDSPYKGKGCESCHGNGSKHNGDVHGILNPTKMPKDKVTDLCSTCHAEKGKYVKTDWLKGKHYMNAGLGCAACHSGHSTYVSFLIKEKVVDLCFTCHSAIRPAFEGGTHNGAKPDTMTCVMCHNPHSL